MNFDIIAIMKHENTPVYQQLFIYAIKNGDSIIYKNLFNKHKFMYETLTKIHKFIFNKDYIYDSKITQWQRKIPIYSYMLFYCIIIQIVKKIIIILNFSSICHFLWYQRGIFGSNFKEIGPRVCVANKFQTVNLKVWVF